MTKKQSKKNRSNINKKRISAIAMSVVVCVVVAGVYVITKPSIKVPPVAPATGLLIETRPILTDAIFTGRVAKLIELQPKSPRYLTACFVIATAKKTITIKHY